MHLWELKGQNMIRVSKELELCRSCININLILTLILRFFFAYFTHKFSYGHVKYSIVKVRTKSCGLIIQLKRLQQPFLWY